MRLRTATALLTITAIAFAACGSDGSSGETPATEPVSSEAVTTEAVTTEPGSTEPGSTEPGSTEPGSTEPGADEVVAGEPFPAARCEQNKAAGTITYLTGFDFAAAASIVDVLVAQDAGYYDDLCLDVEVRPSFSTANYPLVAENQAQFASGGSFSEVVAFADANDAEFVVVAVEGRTPIDVLIVKPGEATRLEDLEGTTIGVKGKLPPSIEVMLAKAGLVEGTDYQTVLLDGFDPTAHIAIPSIVGFPGWRSNEPGALTRAGIPFDLFDPVDYDVPGSFGVIYTNQQFASEHPSAAEDFVRATMRGLADAIADPAAAAAVAVDLINANGNPNFLSPEGEEFRWTTDAAQIVSTTPDGVGPGVPDPVGLQAELDAYAEVGLFGDSTVPDAAAVLGTDLVAGVYDADGTVIWPG
jgi:ABC-type nitrate/sulfonate/bicarbonate transport system substrate-binding protein